MTFGANGTGGAYQHNHSQTLNLGSIAYVNGSGLKYTVGESIPRDTTYTGKSSNMPPYQTVFYWRRTA